MESIKITESDLWAYVSKTADYETIQKVEKWMNSTDFDEALFSKTTTIYNLTNTQHTSVKQAKDRFFNTIKPKTTIWKNILKYAAILIFIISVSYIYNNSIGSLATNQIVIQTTFGEQRSIDLPDGSKVWLNASSQLSYNSKTPRTLYLDGEGFFEVAKDSLHPFTVTTPDLITVKALGTSFNVKSYNNSPTTETKLLTGKVEVKHDKSLTNKVLLTPNNKVTFYKDRKKMIKTKMNINDAKIVWKEGKIHFDNKTFKEIARDLQSQFDIQINFENKTIANSKFTGSFDNTTPINEIFEILKISKDFIYQLNTKTNEWMIK